MDALPSLIDRLLPESPSRVVFGPGTPEGLAARCNLAALLIHAGDPLGAATHRYAFSLGVAHPGPGTRYIHYFTAPDGTLVPVSTTHLPGVDDLGGLVRPDR